MGVELEAAYLGLAGVAIGAGVTVLTSVVVPWIRDIADRRRVERETIVKERRDRLMTAMARLLEHNVALRTRAPEIAKTQAAYAAAVTELHVRLDREHEPIMSVMYGMFSLVQANSHDPSETLGAMMVVLTECARGDLPVGQVIGAVEARAGVAFSEDRSEMRRVPPPVAG